MAERRPGLVARAADWIFGSVNGSPERKIGTRTGSFTAPDFRREPSIQLFTEYKEVKQVRDVIRLHKLGYLQLSSFLWEQMIENPRVRGVADTRVDGHIATAIRWVPARQNEKARQAAAAIVEDWPLIASAQVRRQLHMWGLALGVGFAQKHWYQSPSTLRAIPRLEVYHPSWVTWNWGPRLYQVFTQNGTQWVRSPSLAVPGDDGQPELSTLPLASAMQWVVHEPYGQHSWRHGLIHATWSPWLAHEWARRDMARACEKLGLAALTVKYPDAPGIEKALFEMEKRLKRLHSEGIIPLQQYGGEDGVPPSGFEVAPFEYGGTGYQIIQKTKDSNSTDIAVLWVGHSLTAEATGGTYGAAGLADLIRSDKKVADAESESSTMRQQVVGDWAEVNFGDREIAPIAIYETDPPAINLAAAQTLQFVSAAVAVFAKVAPWIDAEQLLTRFRIPLKPGDHKLVPATPADPATGGSPASPTNVDNQARVQRSLEAIARQLNAVARTDRLAAQTALEGWLVDVTKEATRTVPR